MEEQTKKDIIEVLLIILGLILFGLLVHQYFNDQSDFVRSIRNITTATITD